MVAADPRPGTAKRTWARHSYALEKCREATKVRRDFVKTLLSRKTAPKGWQYCTVHAITHDPLKTPLPEGKLSEFLRGINRSQDIEEVLAETHPGYNRRVHVAIVTARNAPSHERVVKTLKSWGVRVNDAFFLGGIEKAKVLRVLKPYLFFDDQLGHLEGAADEIPSVHVPFGVVNESRGE